MPEPTYSELLEKLRQKKVIEDTGDEDKLYASADAIYAKYENQIGAATLSKKGKPYSDVFNTQGYQVIDLVQEGGGMWGIALVGYTYILEKAGLRFNSLAGTSAGAINTMCLAAMPEGVYNGGTKSKLLTQIIANHDYNDFMDRKDGLLKNLLIGYIKTESNLPIKIVGGLIFLLFSTALFFLISHFLIYKVNGSAFPFVYWLATVLSFLPALVTWYFLKKALNSGFGINPGIVPRRFIKNILSCFGIETTGQLYDKLKSEQFNASTDGEHEGIKGTEVKKRVVLITSNLTHNRIVKFPERAVDYFEDMEKVDPSFYVRASMSIPFFFECVCLHGNSESEFNKTPGKVKTSARFVDGGMLSNFPIREFHNYNKPVPRFPTFGVRLGIIEVKPFQLHIRFMDYILSFLSTFRGFYDNNFIEANEEIKLIVKSIDTGKISWLNFSMNQADKITLFTNGAQAACEHLSAFNWEEYKKLRQELFDKNLSNV